MHRAFAFDLTAACSGFVFALSTAEKFSKFWTVQKGIVIGAETLSKAVDWSDRSTAVLFGDGAGGVSLESERNTSLPCGKSLYRWLSGECLTYGQTALTSPFSDQAVLLFLKMDGRAVLILQNRDVARSIKETIENGPIAASGWIISCFIRQISAFWIRWPKKIGVDRDKLPANMMGMEIPVQQVSDFALQSVWRMA